jgi:hypothetical protein
VGGVFVQSLRLAKRLARSTTIDEHVDVMACQVGDMLVMRWRHGLNAERLYSEHTEAEVRNWGQERMGCRRGPLRRRLALGCGTGRRVTCCLRRHWSNR